MATVGGGLRGFFAYYRKYARTGIHAASAAALTALIGLSFVNSWFVFLAIAVYIIPPVFLYLTGDGDRVPSVVDNDLDEGDADTDTPTDDTEYATSTNDTGPTESDTETTGGWAETDTPIDGSLYDVVYCRNGVYAVGDDGIVLARTDNDWEVALEDGPTAESNPLQGVDTTEDGNGVWFAGDSGVLGRYDVDDKQLTDYSAPNDQTSTWEDIAVTGETGTERIHLVNGSGEILRGEYRSGSVSWGSLTTPGSGSSISAIEFVTPDLGYVCDTNQGVYETTDGGGSYVSIGIEDANMDFTDVAATDPEMVIVVGGNASVFRYDGAVWTRLHAGEDALSAIDLATKDEAGLAAGGGGAVYERTDDGWEANETWTDADLHGIAINDNSDQRLDVAVGANGTIIERHR